MEGGQAMTKAQLKPYWRAVGRAASALGIVGKEAVEKYRHDVMMEEVGVDHARDIDPADGFDRVMYRLAVDAGDWSAASRFATGEERRLAHLVEQCARQVIELKALDNDPMFENEHRAANELAVDYIVGVIAQAGYFVAESPAGGEWWADISANQAFQVFRMLDTHRRRLLKRYDWRPLSFDPDATWYLDGPNLAVGQLSQDARLAIHVGRIPA